MGRLEACLQDTLFCAYSKLPGGCVVISKACRFVCIAVRCGFCHESPLGLLGGDADDEDAQQAASAAVTALDMCLPSSALSVTSEVQNARFAAVTTVMQLSWRRIPREDEALSPVRSSPSDSEDNELRPAISSITPPSKLSRIRDSSCCYSCHEHIQPDPPARVLFLSPMPVFVHLSSYLQVSRGRWKG